MTYRPKPKLTLEDVIARLKRRGVTKAEIARRLGVSETVVYSRLPSKALPPPLPRDPRAAIAVRAARGAREALKVFEENADV